MYMDEVINYNPFSTLELNIKSKQKGILGSSLIEWSVQFDADPELSFPDC